VWSAILISVVTIPDHSRYLQHLASTRFQHLERIRTFTNRRLAQMSKLSQDQKESFSRSFDYISFAAKEASAIQSFADGLSCVRRSLAIQKLTDYDIALLITRTSLNTAKSIWTFSLQLRSASLCPPYATFHAPVHPRSTKLYRIRATGFSTGQ